MSLQTHASRQIQGATRMTRCGAEIRDRDGAPTLHIDGVPVPAYVYYDILFGRDEMLLSSLAVGARGAIGSTYNFAAPLYRGIMEAFAAGDMASARALQEKVVRMISILNRYGGLSAGKALMKFAGIDCGGTRRPLHSISADDEERLFNECASLDVLSHKTGAMV